MRKILQMTNVVFQLMGTTHRNAYVYIHSYIPRFIRLHLTAISLAFCSQKQALGLSNLAGKFIPQNPVELNNSTVHISFRANEKKTLF